MKQDCFIICDDIRSETGNKLSLIGVYSDQVLFHSEEGKSVIWPQIMRMCFYIRFVTEECDDISEGMNFHFFSQAGGEKAELGSGDIAKPAISFPSKVVLTGNYIGYVVKEPGPISYFIEISSKSGMVLLPQTCLGTVIFAEEPKQ